MNLPQLQARIVKVVHARPAGEPVRLVGRALAAGHVPRQQARSDGARRVEVATVDLSGVRGKREHRMVQAVELLAEAETALDVVAGSVPGGILSTKEHRVVARHVASASNVAHDKHVLRLGDDGFKVPSVVPGKG